MKYFLLILGILTRRDSLAIQTALPAGPDSNPANPNQNRNIPQVNQISNRPNFDFCRENLKNQPNTGSECISTPQGLIPVAANMVSTLIISPENGQSVSKAAGFNVVFESIGLMSGNGLNLANQFMKQPQSLNQRTGMIEGMQSISIQSLENELLAPEASVLSFFRILNTPSDPTGRTRFTIAINPGQIKTVGVHRMCTLAMSSSGIPAIMPVAQRGAQDDCIRVFIDQ